MTGDAIGLGFDGLAIRVSCPDRALLTWLCEFCTPWFETVSASETHCEVAVVPDEAIYARRLAKGPRADGAAVRCFSRDSGPIHLPRWHSAAGEEVVFERRLRAFYGVNGRTPRVEVVVRPGDLSARFATMQIVRELAQEHARANGRLLLHAAALALDDRAFLIAGAKGAGKTSMLAASLLGTGGRFISNDRVITRLDGGVVVGRGVPTLVSVRRATLDAHPDLCRRLARSGFHPLRTVEEARKDPQPLQIERPSIALSPAQLCTALGATPVAEEQLSALLFLRDYVPGGDGRMETIDAPTSEGRLSASLLGGGNRVDDDFFFAPALAGRGAAAARRDQPRDLARRVPAFDVRAATAGKGGGAAHELLRSLAG